MRSCKGFLIALSCFLLYSPPVLIGQAHAAAAQTIRINGSGTGLDMLKPLIEAYERSHPGVVFRVTKPLGSSGAIKAVIAGALDIAVTSKPLSREEEARGAAVSIFGRTPLAIVVNRNVSVRDISTAELENIYSGVTRKWSNGENIRVILRPLEDIDTKILRGLSPGMDAAISKAQMQQGMLMAVTDPESNEVITKSAGSIGASGLAGIMAGKVPVKILSLDGIMPAARALEDGRYPLAKDINFVTKGKLPPVAADFLDFVYSGKGRAIVEKIGVFVRAGRRADR